MRQESLEVCRAFIAGRVRSMKRTRTDGTTLYLHGNRIAWWNPDGSVSMTLAGWGTPTTRDRLNTLCWLMFATRPFHQKKHQQHYDGKPIDVDAVFTFHPIADEFKLAA